MECKKYKNKRKMLRNELMGVWQEFKRNPGLITFSNIIYPYNLCHLFPGAINLQTGIEIWDCVLVYMYLTGRFRNIGFIESNLRIVYNNILEQSN